MIQAKRILTVDNKTSRLDQPITLYKNDGGIMLEIEIRNVKYRFGRTPSLDKFDSAFYKVTTLVNFTTSGKKVVVPKKGICQDGVAKIFIAEEFIDQLEEVGSAQMQFILHDWQGSSITIPPCSIEVRKRIIDTTVDEFSYYDNRIVHNHRVFNHTNIVRKYGEVNGTLQLSNAHEFQTATFTGNTTITAPTVDINTPDEIHLYFTLTSDGLNVTFNNIEWDSCGIFNDWKTNINYELILYPKDATTWICTYRMYN